MTSAIAPAALASTPRIAPWNFRENFSQGIPAWMSYPLAQDVGYDPSLYTAQSGGHWELVRDVIANGEKQLHVGLLRPLRFHATRGSQLRFTAALSMGGALTSFTVTLGTTNGKRYSARLPDPPGNETFDISGAQLGLDAHAADVDVVVIEATVHDPVLGSHNRLVLSSFQVEAERDPDIELEAPRMMSSATGELIAREVVTSGKKLTLRTAPNAGAADAKFYAPDGKQQLSVPLPAGAEKVVDLGATPTPGLWRAEIASAVGHTTFEFLVLGQTPPHPRVLFGAKRLEQLRDDPGLASLRLAIHRKAAELAKGIAFNVDAGENIAHLSPDSVFLGLVPYFTLMDSYANAISYNALDYRLNGDAEALAFARRALQTVSAWPTWTPPWFAAHGLHTYYEAGIFTQRVAFGYDLVAGELSAADRARIAEAFWRNEIAPAVQEYFANDRLPIAASNHMAHTVGGALAAALAVAGDVTDWNTRFAPAVSELLAAYDHLLRGLFPGDGSEAEPAGYENFAMQGLSWGAAALDAFGIHPARLEAMLDSFRWIQYAEVRPDLVLDTGDFNGTLPSLAGFAWPTEHSRDPILRALYERSDHTLGEVPKLRNTGRAPESAPDLLDLACCTQPPAQAQIQPPPSRIFAGRGSAVLRSGWNNDATVISLRAGPWFNHEHHDQGSFQVAAFGEKLIGEAGYANYYTDPRYANYFTQAPGHNTVVVDDNAFSQQASDGRYWPSLQRRARIARHLFSARIDFVVTDLAGAYDGALRRYTREFLFLKPEVLIVRDRISAPKPHRFSWLLHVPTAARATTDTNRAQISATHAAALITTFDGNWKAQSTPIPIDAYGNLDREHVQPRSMLRISTHEQSTATFLVGMRFIQLGGQGAALQPTREANGKGFTLHNGGSRRTDVLFRTAPGKLSVDGFGTDGDAIAAVTNGTRTTVFAASARELGQTGAPLVSLSSPVDLIFSRENGRQELTVSTQRPVAVKVWTHAGNVVLDGHAIPAPASGSLSLRLAAGEHAIRISQ